MDTDKDHKAKDSKPRLRWSCEFHHRFMDAVNQLGGPNSSASVPFVLLKPYQGIKFVWLGLISIGFSFFVVVVLCLEATPKGLMRIMETPELTLYHLKSHLQKYRLGISERSVGNKQDATKPQECQTQKDFGDQVDIIVSKEKDDQPNTNLQIKEAIEIQLEVQKKLHEQIEVQRQLQVRIEAQGKYLQSVLMKAQETLSGYTSSNLGIDFPRSDLYKGASMANRSCLSPSFSGLTQEDEEEIEEEKCFLGTKKSENGGIEPTSSSADSSSTSSESSDAKTEFHFQSVARRSSELQLMEIKPVEVMEPLEVTTVRTWDCVNSFKDMETCSSSDKQD